MTDSIQERFDAIKEFFAQGATYDISFRKAYLSKLYDSIKAHEEDMAHALYEDLHKSAAEAYISETSVVLTEIRQQIKHIGKWSHNKRVSTPLFLLPSSSRIMYEPKGVVLIIAPWNYPFQLALDPLVGAIAAGDCVALKPSTTSASTCRIIKQIITEVFPPRYVSVFDGDHAQTAELLDQRFDHIFFTGGTAFGRTVMEKAAQHLTPVTLELGGKSPCIVDASADVDLAARKITWGKLLNAGQTCIAPDYLLVHSSLKEALVKRIEHYIESFYGSDIRCAPAYPRIISDKAFVRLQSYIDDANDIIRGGDYDPQERFIAPTIIGNPDPLSPVMQEEIFGPILPLLTFEDIDEATAFINAREKPLALYYFGKKRNGQQVLAHTTSGGACINDTIVHVANPFLPFGGVGNSGMGRYHFKWSFETFSNTRGVVVSHRKADVMMRYPPYDKNLKMLKKLL